MKGGRSKKIKGRGGRRRRSIQTVRNSTETERRFVLRDED